MSDNSTRISRVSISREPNGYAVWEHHPTLQLVRFFPAEVHRSVVVTFVQDFIRVVKPGFIFNDPDQE